MPHQHRTSTIVLKMEAVPLSGCRPGTASERARLESAEALVDVSDKARLAQLAIGENIQPHFGLLADGLHHRAANAARVGVLVEGLSLLLRVHHVDQLLRTRQASYVGGENSIRAVLHG